MNYPIYTDNNKRMSAEEVFSDDFLEAFEGSGKIAEITIKGRENVEDFNEYHDFG